VLLIRSPIAGRIVNSKISRGQTVDPNYTAFEIADLSSVWLELRVFERDLVAIRTGDVVEVTTQFAPDKPIHGKVAHVGDVVDAQTRSAPVRVEVANAQGQLRPGQSVNARIHTTAPAAAALISPRASVTRVDGKPTVFVMLDKAVEPRTVDLGPADRENIEIASGLVKGELVVVGGLLAIKSEIFR
jgi:cobalt-zinc-cadmium efflux system membrane fusion protein